MPRIATPLFAFAALASAALLAGCSSGCNDVTVNIAAACVPDLVAADQTALIEVREACGIQCARPPQCTAVLLGGSVMLELSEQQCPDLFVGCSTQLCFERVASCRLPALAAGDYPLVVPGAQSRVLHVRASGGVSACHLPVPSDGGI